MGFVVDKFALGKVPLRVLLFYPNDIIPRMLHKTFSCSSYQKVEGAKPGNLPKSNVISEIGEQWLEKYVRFTGLRVVSWFRRLVSGLSPWRTDFEPVPILVGFEVDKVALRHGFSEYFRSPPLVTFQQYSTRIHFFKINLNTTNVQRLGTSKKLKIFGHPRASREQRGENFHF